MKYTIEMRDDWKPSDAIGKNAILAAAKPVEAKKEDKGEL